MNSFNLIEIMNGGSMLLRMLPSAFISCLLCLALCTGVCLGDEVSREYNPDACPPVGLDELAWNESGTYVDAYGNMATVTMPTGVSGSISLFNLGATNLVCDRVIRCSSSGKWTLVDWCNEQAWDGLYVLEIIVDNYRYLDDWCHAQCPAGSQSYTPHTQSDWDFVHSVRVYKWVPK